MNFGLYSKLIGALIGSGVGLVGVWVAANFGLGTCTIPTDLTPETCSILGQSVAELQRWVVAGFASIFVWRFPANQ